MPSCRSGKSPTGAVQHAQQPEPWGPSACARMRSSLECAPTCKTKSSPVTSTEVTASKWVYQPVHVGCRRVPGGMRAVAVCHTTQVRALRGVVRAPHRVGALPSPKSSGALPSSAPDRERGANRAHQRSFQGHVAGDAPRRLCHWGPFGRAELCPSGSSYDVRSAELENRVPRSERTVVQSAVCTLHFMFFFWNFLDVWR